MPERNRLFGDWFQDPRWLRWFLVGTGMSLLVYLANIVFGEVRPGNLWSFFYALGATVLMLGAGAIGLRRRMVRMAARRPLGRTGTWLQFHLYGGALSLLLVFMHCGFRVPVGLLDWWLWFLSIWVTASGLLGVLLQKVIPRMLASGLSIEVVYERIPDLVVQIRERSESLALTCVAPVQDYYRKTMAAALAEPTARWTYAVDITGGIQRELREFSYLRDVLATEEREKLDRLQELYRTKLEIDAHFTLQKALRWWLVTHVPVSLVLLLLIFLHLFAVLYY